MGFFSAIFALSDRKVRATSSEGMKLLTEVGVGVGPVLLGSFKRMIFGMILRCLLISYDFWTLFIYFWMIGYRWFERMTC